jgi:hypothetical protein
MQSQWLELSMKVTTLACLFVSNDGRISIRLLDTPAPPQHEFPSVPPGMMHACQVLGLPARRVFKRTVDGALPVYEEI